MFILWKVIFNIGIVFYPCLGIFNIFFEAFAIILSLSILVILGKFF